MHKQGLTFAEQFIKGRSQNTLKRLRSKAKLFVSCVFPSYDNARDAAARTRQLTRQKPNVISKNPPVLKNTKRKPGCCCPVAAGFLQGISTLYVCRQHLRPVFAVQLRCKYYFNLHPGGFEHRNPGPAAGVKRESTERFWQSLDGPGVSKSCPLH